MKISAKQVLRVLHIISWIIFIGLCIEAGGIFFNAFFSQAFGTRVTPYFWQKIDLSFLYQYDKSHFFVMATVMMIVTVLKALLFYRIVKLLHDKKLDLARPFNPAVVRFITLVAFLSLGIGLFSHCGSNFAAWLGTQGVTMPGNEQLHFNGVSVWFFMALILFVIAQVVKRGIGLEEENALTV